MTLLLLLVSGLSIYFAASLAFRQTEQQSNQKAAETLAVQTEILTGVLEKYRLLPPLLTRQSDVVSLFSSSEPWAERVALAHIKAEEVAGLSGAREVSFFWPDGRLLASARNIYSEADDGASFLIEAARQGRLGRLAVALSSPDRAYAFSAGVRRDGRLVGVVVVYVGFEGIEATWSLSTNPIFVSDSRDTVILTNRPAWRLRQSENVYANEAPADRFKNLQRDLPLLTWQLHVLSSLAPARDNALLAGVAAGLLSLVGSLIVLLLLSRREQAEQQLRRDKGLALRLERIVRDRTRALSKVNTTLTREVEERRQAEEKLRKAQAELVQTAKLAVLGQMSATLSHEMNQPLAAIGTYAANAQRFIELSRGADAISAIHRISAMVDRMAELSGALLSFSRKPGSERRPVLLSSALDEALILVRPRATKSGVRILPVQGAETCQVLAGKIRLSQVFVNLINNAVDALKDRRDGEVRLTVEPKERAVFIRIADNGPGIPPDVSAQIFDPFFTTKPQGEGIGIGLSIVYNIIQEFGGSIKLVDQDQPGCTFEIQLRAAEGEKDR